MASVQPTKICSTNRATYYYLLTILSGEGTDTWIRPGSTGILLLDIRSERVGTESAVVLANLKDNID